MDRPRKLRERSYPALLAQALEARAEGLVVLRDCDDVRHGTWVQRGFVVGVHVAGRHDPLLSLLAHQGWLDTTGLRRCLAALPHSAQRSGALARSLCGVDASLVHETLQGQLLERYLALLELAEEHGHDAQLEPGPVPDAECSVRMPLGTLQRRAGERALRFAPPFPAPEPAPRTDTREDARKALRALAKTHHPDRHPECDAAAREQLTRELAEATAAYHGLR